MQPPRFDVLARHEAREVMEQLLSGRVGDQQIVELLLAMRDKGETAAEVVGFAEVMRAQAKQILAEAGVKVESLIDSRALLDTCGTGGDNAGTWNISTAAGLVIAALGVPVAKHGNRAQSSKSGAADVLAALGVNIDCDIEFVERSLWEANCGSLRPPRHHENGPACSGWCLEPRYG